MAYTTITNPAFLRFQARFLPTVSAFISGSVLSYMVTDNDHFNKFQKYKHIAVPQAPGHTFYVYMHTPQSYDDASAALAASAAGSDASAALASAALAAAAPAKPRHLA
jgi:hypothetical protein